MANSIQLAETVALVETRTAAGTTARKMDERSPDNAEMLPYWQQVADIRGGVRAMKTAGEKYLPKFADETKEEYAFRLSVAKFTNIYKDVSDALASKPFQEEIVVKQDEAEAKLPPDIEALIENIDGAGNNLTKFGAKTFSKGIDNAIDWIFVDMPKVNPLVIRSVEDAKKANIRPYWSHVLGENMLEVKATFVASRQVLTYARILEPGKPTKVREFERLDTSVITWKLWYKTERGDWAVEDEGTLGIDEIPLFPFITGENEGNGWCFIASLQDACDLQVTLYRQESQLEYAKTMTAYPMLSGNGVKPPKDGAGKAERLLIGPNRVLYAPPDGMGNSGSWAYVEPSSTSLKFLSDDVEKTKQDLRELGKQPLTATTGNLTVITTAVAAGKAKSAVKQWGLNLKDTLENAMMCSYKWLKLSPDLAPDVVVYDDYDNMSEGDVEALAAARAGGDISRETFLGELKRRAILSSEFDFDIESQRLLDETPSGAGEVDGTGEGNDTLNPAD